LRRGEKKRKKRTKVVVVQGEVRRREKGPR
jgi:hypothetical protein